MTIIACPNCGTRNRVAATSRGTPRCAKCKQGLPWIVNADTATFAEETTSSVPVVVGYRKASLGRWRLAAMVAGLLMAGTIVYETVQGPTPGSRETAGTMGADTPTTLDSVALGTGPVTGRATLYRDKSGLAVGLEVSAPEPVDVLVSTGDHSFRINGLGSSTPAGNTRQTIALPGVRVQGQKIELSFLIGERTVSRATLHAPSGP